jgi:hypothetical protein
MTGAAYGDENLQLSWRDGKQPGPKVTVLPVARQRFERRQKDLRREVFRFVPIIRPIMAVAIYAVNVIVV